MKNTTQGIGNNNLDASTQEAARAEKLKQDITTALHVIDNTDHQMSTLPP